MNPLPNRPILNNASLPLTIPNVPQMDQMPYNGRPRKLVPEVGKEFPALNGVQMMNGPMTAPASTASQGPILDNRNASGSNGNTQTNAQQQGPQSAGSFQQQPSQGQIQTLQLEGSQDPNAKDTQEDRSERQQITSIFRPNSDWREQLERARSESQGGSTSGVSAWEGGKEDEEVDKEDVEMDDDEAASTVSDDDGKVWRPRRTLRKSVTSTCESS